MALICGRLAIPGVATAVALVGDDRLIRRFVPQGRRISINESGTESVELIAIPDGY
jgi:hypothetical protein